MRREAAERVRSDGMPGSCHRTLDSYSSDGLREYTIHRNPARAESLWPREAGQDKRGNPPRAVAKPVAALPDGQDGRQSATSLSAASRRPSWHPATTSALPRSASSSAQQRKGRTASLRLQIPLTYVNYHLMKTLLSEPKHMQDYNLLGRCGTVIDSAEIAWIIISVRS
jgi:hypothetical protein